MAKKGASPFTVLGGENDEGSRRPVDFRAVKVDGKSIKADTWYRLKDGKFVEANE